MSVSYSVVGIRPADERFKEMRNIRDLCVKQGITVPPEVYSFFNFEEPDPAGVRVSLPTKGKDRCVTEYRDQYRWGYEVEVKKLPADLKIIRFEIEH